MEQPRRKSPRLKEFDYSSDNYYFITICTYEKRCLFGSIEKLNQYGEIAQKALLDIPNHFRNIAIDQYVVMPNHIHAVIVLGCGETPAVQSCDLGTVIGLYKSGVSRVIHQIDPTVQVWQRSFYDRVIRSTDMYQRICQYIADNPLKWQLDEYYSD